MLHPQLWKCHVLEALLHLAASQACPLLPARELQRVLSLEAELRERLTCEPSCVLPQPDLRLECIAPVAYDPPEPEVERPAELHSLFALHVLLL